MAKAMVVSTAVAGGLAVTPSVDIEVAGDAQEFAEKTLRLLSSRERMEGMGRTARARALREYAWESNLSRVGDLLSQGARAPSSSSTDVPADARAAEHIDEA